VSRNTLISTGGDQFIFWEATTGKLIRALDRPNERSLSGLSPDTKTLTTWNRRDYAIRLWDIASGKEIRRFAQEGISYSAFSPNARMLASTRWPNVIQLWDLLTGKEVRRIEAQHVPGKLAFSPDGRTLLASNSNSVGADFTVRLWDVATGKERWRMDTRPWESLGAAFCPDGRHIAVVGRGWKGQTNQRVGVVVLCDAVTGKELRRCEGHTDHVWHVSFSPNGRMLATGASDKTIRLWEVATGQLRQKPLSHEAEILGLSFSPDGRMLASTDMGSIGLVWDLTTAVGKGSSHIRLLSAKDLQDCWMELADVDAARAYQSILQLVASPEQAVGFLKDRLPPVVAANPQQMTRLLTDLDAKDFAQREQATRELENLGLTAEPGLRQALRGKPSPEVRRRVEQLLQGLEAKAQLRQIRALEVLEDIGTPAAREVLQSLAKGAVEARLTQEANATMERLPQR